MDGGPPAVFQNAAWSRNQPDIVVFDDVFVAENVCSGIEVESRHRQKLHELVIGAPGVALNRTLKNQVDQIEAHNRQLRERADAIPARVRNGLEVDAFCALTPIQDLARELEAADRRVTAARSAARIADTPTFTAIDLPIIDLGPIEEVLLLALPGLEADALRRVQAHLDRLGRGGESWVNEGIVALPMWTQKARWAVEAVRARLEYMPLRKPTEVDRELMEALLFYSNSLLGRMFGLLERAAIKALDQEECLSASLIATVALRGRRDEDG